MLRASHHQPPTDAVVRRWAESIFATYPPETARFLAMERDRFANPVGHAVREAVVLLVRSLWQDVDAETIDGALDRIVRVRSVQDLAPSEAVGFVFLLKRALDEALGPDGTAVDPAERRRLEDRIDAMALRAFDIYMGCREQLFEVRLHERDRWNAVALKRLRGHIRSQRPGVGVSPEEPPSPGVEV